MHTRYDMRKEKVRNKVPEECVSLVRAPRALRAVVLCIFCKMLILLLNIKIQISFIKQKAFIVKCYFTSILY